MRAPDLITEARETLVAIGVFDGDDVAGALMHGGYSAERSRAITAAPRLVRALLDHQQERDAHIALLNDWIRKAVEIASVFQEGELRGVLPLGGSSVHDGLRWLLAERARLLEQLAQLRAERAKE